MKFFAKKRMDFPDDEIRILRRRLAEAEGRIRALEEKASRAGLLEAVIQGVAEPILVIDRDYNVVLKNPAADGFWGLPKDGKTFKCHEVLHGGDKPCDRKDWPCPLRQVLETGEPVTVLHEHRRGAGVRKYELLASPLVLSGELGGIIETARDITESEKAAAELRRRESQQRAILDSIPDMAWLKDRDSRFIAVNEAFAAAAGGLKPEDLAGKTDYDVWPEGLADHYITDDREVLETGERKSVEEPLEGADGEIRWIYTIKTPIRNAMGEITGTAGIARDITKRKRAELLLRESEERFRSLFENSLDAIIVSSPDGRNYAANPAACRMLGYAEEELIRVGRDGIVDKFDPNLPGYLEERAAKGRARAELTLVRKDGLRFPAEVSASVFMDREGRQRASVIIRDISERKALERQRSDFLAMVTHDLKSPLTAILGYSELIKDECERRGNESVRDMAEAVEQGGHRLLRLVEDFLTVSRMETEKLELKKTPADVREIIAKVEKDFQLQAKNSGISLSAGLPGGTVPQPNIDRPQVERVLGNLVQNAINYTPAGGSIIIGAEESSKDGRGYIKVFVSDTGRGIPKEEQAKVFSKYYRSSRTAGIKGSGLGLTIAKAISEAHGGWIELESEPGKGSTFSLFLPV